MQNLLSLVLIVLVVVFPLYRFLRPFNRRCLLYTRVRLAYDNSTIHSKNVQQNFLVIHLRPRRVQLPVTPPRPRYKASGYQGRNR